MPHALTWKKLAAVVVLSAFAVVFLVLGIAFNYIVDGIIDLEIKKKLPIKNGTFAFGFWQKPPVPVSFNIYVFDIVNPMEVLAGTEVPAVIEKGPYVYRMHIEKTNIKWHENDTVEFVQPQTFHFDRGASVGPDTDTFTTINIPYVTVATILQYEMPWLQAIVDTFMRSQKEDTFMNRTVHDIWWGYSDPVLEDLAKLLHKFNITSELFNGKFGFYMDRNNTGDGLYNVYSGVNEDFSNFVIIDRWNGMRNMSLWTTPYANQIRGTDGSMQPPHVSKDSHLSIFDAYLHRSLNLVYNGTSSYRNIRTLRFHVPFSEFAAPSENPNNAGFCTPDINHCLPSGAYNLSIASYFAPMYVSLPHFVGGDPYYQQQIKGLRPDPEKHQPFYDIQALTGVSMRAARRYQIVVRGQSFQHFTKFQHFPEAYLPVLWIDGMAELDQDTADMFMDLIQNPLDAMPYVRGTVFAAGGLLVIIVISLLILWRRQKKQSWNKNSDHDQTNLLNPQDKSVSRINGDASSTNQASSGSAADGYGVIRSTGTQQQHIQEMDA